MYELGIDLGTTFTAAAVRTGDRVEIAPLGTRSPVIPSVVLFGEDGTTLTGDAAQRRALSEPTRVAREFKRRLGDPLPVIVGGAPHSAESLSAILLRSVVETVSTLQGGPPNRVALTHPANWGSYKKELYAQAVRFADLPDVVFLTEPEAAAIHYASQERVDDGSIVAVYDLGGGTFDATVLEKRGEGFEVLGQPEGIERLGGIDFDQAVFSHVADSLGGALDELDRSDPALISAVARMRADCVDAKEALSADTEASIVVALPGLHTEVRITRPELESMLRRPIADTVSALRRALRDASVEPDRLAAVLLVGGSSRIPMVAEMVGAELGRPVAVDAHPKYTIALGAARYAGLGLRRSDDPRPAAAVVRTPAAPAPAPVVPAPVAPAPVAPLPVAPLPVAPAPVAPVPVVPAPAAPVPAPIAVAPAPAAPLPVAPVPVAPAPAAPVPPRAPVVPEPVAPALTPVVSPAPSPAARASRRRGLLFGAIAAAVVVVVAGVGVALSLGGGDDGGGDAGGNGCPASGPFVCITSTSVTGDGVVAEFQLADVDLDRTDLRFFLDTNPDAFVSWSVADPFRSQIGQVATGVRLCAVVNDSSGAAIAGSGNCVILDG